MDTEYGNPINLPNRKWIISVDKADADDKLGIHVVKVDENNSILSVDVAKISSGLSVEDFIKYLQDEGIAILENHKKNLKIYSTTQD